MCLVPDAEFAQGLPGLSVILFLFFFVILCMSVACCLHGMLASVWLDAFVLLVCDTCGACVTDGS